MTTKQGLQVPETNKTSLGLYVTPQEAYAMWKADPARVNIIDVRTFEEYTFVGHLEMAQEHSLCFSQIQAAHRQRGAIRPCAWWTTSRLLWGAKSGICLHREESVQTHRHILIYCATGGRGAMAINQLAAAGFVHVYNIINGLEGDRVNDPGSVYNGKHMRNGWKNSGLPWGYNFHPDLMWVSQDQ